MYAIVEVAGKQYKVEKGMKLYVDKLKEEEKTKITIDKVLLVKEDNDVKIGAPYVEGVTIKTQVVSPEVKDKKVIVYKYKNKTGYHKKQGHRQKYTCLEILDIVSGSKKKVAPKKEESVKEEGEKTVKKATKPATKTTAKKATKPVVKKTETKTTKKAKEES